MKIIIQIVLYNKKFEDSITLASLYAIKEILQSYPVKIKIQDNSCEEMRDCNYLLEINNYVECTYHHSPQNLTLREIYNQSLSKLVDGDYICLLDDDTNITEKYFRDAVEYIRENPDIGLIVPQIYVYGKMYSPHKSYFFFNKPIMKKINGLCKTQFMSAINSGMIINAKFFSNSGFRYPSYTDFYGTDKVFFDKYAEHYEYFYVLDVFIEHNVSNHPENTDVDGYIKILNITNKFWREYLKDKKMLLSLYSVYMFLYSLKMSLKKKNISFVMNFIKKGLKNE
ncbi:glycosyltransferase [Hafnia paralvei]|uniref:Glycosyltransferase family 2 n=1 Tax=Hafnia alvei TaxID=569 RepID=A0A172WZX6_HAFAL|nr:glycosyltransferase [Hafnia paralvei]ANF29918.1 glycosyltransferase family 2 [Hafnia alvei]TBM00966.1 glycosyltransferase [Hafnia paralvei]